MPLLDDVVAKALRKVPAGYARQGDTLIDEAGNVFTPVGTTVDGRIIFRNAEGTPVVLDDVVQVQRGSTGEGWDFDANNPRPNTRYEFENGYSYQTDELGRVINVDADLELGAWHRNKYQQRVSGRDCRLDTDCGGHLIASIFGGAGEGVNLVPMNTRLNGSGGPWYNMETEWRNALDAGQSVNVRIQPSFSGSSTRPDSFRVEYTIGSTRYRPSPIKNTPTGE